MPKATKKTAKNTKSLKTEHSYMLTQLITLLIGVVLGWVSFYALATTVLPESFFK